MLDLHACFWTKLGPHIWLIVVTSVVTVWVDGALTAAMSQRETLNHHKDLCHIDLVYSNSFYGNPLLTQRKDGTAVKHSLHYMDSSSGGSE